MRIVYSQSKMGKGIISSSHEVEIVRRVRSYFHCQKIFSIFPYATTKLYFFICCFDLYLLTLLTTTNKTLFSKFLIFQQPTLPITLIKPQFLIFFHNTSIFYYSTFSPLPINESFQILEFPTAQAYHHSEQAAKFEISPSCFNLQLLTLLPTTNKKKFKKFSLLTSHPPHHAGPATKLLTTNNKTFFQNY